jgi:hypothetical protein
MVTSCVWREARVAVTVTVDCPSGTVLGARNVTAGGDTGNAQIVPVAVFGGAPARVALSTKVSSKVSVSEPVTTLTVAVLGELTLDAGNVSSSPPPPRR